MAKDFSFTKTFERKYDDVIETILAKCACDGMCADDEDCTDCIHELFEEEFVEIYNDSLAEVREAFYNWLNENMNDFLEALKKKLKENE